MALPLVVDLEEECHAEEPPAKMPKLGDPEVPDDEAARVSRAADAARAAARLKELKESRLRQIVEDMDAQMRSWCQQLAAQKCKGEPWRNVGNNKLKVVVEPSRNAATFEGAFIPVGATFGVEEVKVDPTSGHKWLRWTQGGWISNHSRKAGREEIVVAEKVARHLEMASEDVFRVGPNEDRRAAYMRMVHRRSEADLQIPEGLKVELIPYQVEGVEWLVSLYNNDLSGMLADEMGLGKTIQTLGLLAFLRESKKRYGPHLIICPKSVVQNWEKEIARCFPEYVEHCIIFQGTPAEREKLGKKIQRSVKKSRRKLIVVTNYEQIHPERNKVLQEPKWELIIIDEGHRMKNQKSVFHQTMKEHFSARMKLLLTGTPLQNSLDELFSMLNYLLPEIFTSATSFKSWFAAPFLDSLESMSMNEYYVEFDEAEERLLISNLHAMLAPFVMQRTKADVLSLEKLRPKKEIILRVPLSAWQKQTYEDLKNKTLRRLGVDGAEISPQQVKNITMQLRKISLHPYLFGRSEAFTKTAENVVRASGKLEVLDRLLRKMRRFGHRVLVFSQFTSMLDILEEFLKLRCFSFERIDGQVSAEERKVRIDRFSDPSGDTFVFLLSSRAGAVGLNLQAADTVVLFDLDWNPQMDKQAMARAHRLGQTKEVLVVRLLSLSPVEEHMERVADEKLDLERKIIGAGSFSGKGNAMTPEERVQRLRALLGAECKAQCTDGTAGTETSRQHRATGLREANELLARGTDGGKEESAAFAIMDEELGLTLGQHAEEDFPFVEVETEGSGSNILVRCGRLMRRDEVPACFDAECEESDGD